MYGISCCCEGNNHKQLPGQWELISPIGIEHELVWEFMFMWMNTRLWAGMQLLKLEIPPASFVIRVRALIALSGSKRYA